jgi:integrase
LLHQTGEWKMAQPANVFLPPGSSRYCYKFKVHGAWYRGATGQTDRREAIKFARNEKARIQRDTLIHGNQSGAGMTVLTAVSKHLEELRDSAESSTANPKVVYELRHLEQNLVKIVEALGPDLPMRCVTADMLRSVIRRRMSEPKCTGQGSPLLKKNSRTGEWEPQRLSGRTINKTTWQLFRPIYRKARDCWHVPVESIVWKHLALKEAGPRKREVSIDEEKRIRALPEFREGYGACFSFGIISGLRLQNLTELKWSQVDLANREVRVVQKGGREHTLCIDREMMRILLAERGKDPTHVFTYLTQRTYFNTKANRQCTRNERCAVTRAGFKTWFKRVARKLEIDIRVHDLRRTAGARLLRATGNIKAVQQLLGHSNIKTTADHYSHIPPLDQLSLQDRAHDDTERRRTELSLL